MYFIHIYIFVQLCMRDREESKTILLTRLMWEDYRGEEIVEF